MAERMDDRDLRNRQLLLTDPYAQEGLVRDIPEGAALTAVINTYKFERWPNEKCYCCVCRGHHHQNGFTALLSSGDLAMLGSKCGGDVFGEDWHAAEQRMKDEGKRQYELHKLDRLQPVIPILLRALGAWRGQVDTIVNRRRGFENAFPDLLYYLQQAEGGALWEDVRTIDRAQSARQDRTVYTSSRVARGRFEGAIFLERYEPLASLDRAIAALETAYGSIGSTDSLSTTMLTRRRRAVEEGFENVERIAQVYDAGLAFLTVPNLSTIVDWSNSVGLAQVVYTMEGETMSSDKGKALKLLPLRPLDKGVLDTIREYRRAE